MAEIHELIERVTEPGLKAQLQAAVDKLAKQKKFGLVFEEHLPECTPLYEVPVKKGRLVSRKRRETNDLYVVLTITDGVATCLPKNGGEAVKLLVDELVSVAEFGEPIYPYLQPVDTSAAPQTATSGIPSLKRTITMPYSSWNISTPGKWIAFILIHLIMGNKRTGNITTIMWMAMMNISIANGCP